MMTDWWLVIGTEERDPRDAKRGDACASEEKANLQSEYHL